LYEKPANAFVAGFIGSPAMNLVTARLTDGGAVFGGVTVPLSREIATAAEGDTVTVGFRPESLEPTAAEVGAIAINVDLVEELGSDAYCYGTLVDSAVEGGNSNVVARVNPRATPAMGDTLHLRIRPEEVHVFSATTGGRLP
jgi:multiple sugar transport system ATP-binding protein